MRLFAIGDIHGCHLALSHLLTHMNFGLEDTVVFLGDYVDRGPNTRSVINQIVKLQQKCRVIALRGNHEVMMLEALSSWNVLTSWNSCGGLETLKSYNAKNLQEIPAKHWDFIDRTLPYFESESFIFVHGGVIPDLQLDQQPDKSLYWQRFHHQLPHASGKKIICGHTPQSDGLPVDIGHATCIDTHAYSTGWLTCLNIDNFQYHQFQPSGEMRKGSLVSPPLGV